MQKRGQKHGNAIHRGTDAATGEKGKQQAPLQRCFRAVVLSQSGACPAACRSGGSADLRRQLFLPQVLGVQVGLCRAGPIQGLVVRPGSRTGPDEHVVVDGCQPVSPVLSRTGAGSAARPAVFRQEGRAGDCLPAMGSAVFP
ncbi:hypothetical protein QU38_01230, partial [Staphylococcus aureus]